MLTIYIAGPITRNPNYELEFKQHEIRLSTTLSESLCSDCWRIINPVKETQDIKEKHMRIAKEGNRPFSLSDPTFYSEVMEKCRRLVNESDAIVINSAYHRITSKGVEIEIDLAIKLGIPVFLENYGLSGYRLVFSRYGESARYIRNILNEA